MFRLTADDGELRSRLASLEPGEQQRLMGAWKTEGAAEVLTVTEILDPLPSAPTDDAER